MRQQMPFSVPAGPSPEWSTTLSVDALFYSAARKARERGRAATNDVRRAEKRVFMCRMQMEAIKERSERPGEDPHRYRDEFEPLAIEIANLESRVVEAQGAVLRELVLAHILSAASLEAHINIRAGTLLPEQEWAAFERLTIDAKWLFLARLRGLPGLDVGSQPFQDFDRLIKIRDRLVHDKLEKAPYRGFEDPASFGEKLALTFDDVDRSLKVAREMVELLASQLGEDRAPCWLDSQGSHFLDGSEQKPEH
jgi:hypothetical protein